MRLFEDDNVLIDDVALRMVVVVVELGVGVEGMNIGLFCWGGEIIIGGLGPNKIAGGFT